jgi:hypothetical protein
MFEEIRSPNTLRNLAVNPSIEVNVVDPILRKATCTACGPVAA